MKICKSCGLTKNLSEFSLNKQTTDGLHTKCKSCLSAIKADDYKRKWFKYQVRLKRSEAKKKNLPFNLTEDYLKSIWTENCPVFKVPFVRFDKAHCFSPALDRIKPDKGYVQGNVVYISARANRIKYDASLDELKQVLNYFEGATTISKESTLK